MLTHCSYSYNGLKPRDKKCIGKSRKSQTKHCHCFHCMNRNLFNFFPYVLKYVLCLMWKRRPFSCRCDDSVPSIGLISNKQYSGWLVNLLIRIKSRRKKKPRNYKMDINGQIFTSQDDLTKVKVRKKKYK